MYMYLLREYVRVEQNTHSPHENLNFYISVVSYFERGKNSESIDFENKRELSRTWSFKAGSDVQG